ncbi:hypothetical protein [Rossellomorea marisflavi]|uniref:hypothetical protein n=1 Tax=Rossellomorea marisflavi TaxID=189381 RepID=UPI003F9F96C4
MENILTDIRPNNIIRFMTDDTYEMIKVECNDQRVEEGHKHDYYNGCRGWNDIPSFETADELVAIMVEFLKGLGHEVEVVRGSYSFD